MLSCTTKAVVAVTFGDVSSITGEVLGSERSSERRFQCGWLIEETDVRTLAVSEQWPGCLLRLLRTLNHNRSPNVHDESCENGTHYFKALDDFGGKCGFKGRNFLWQFLKMTMSMNNRE